MPVFTIAKSCPQRTGLKSPKPRVVIDAKPYYPNAPESSPFRAGRTSTTHPGFHQLAPTKHHGIVADGGPGSK